MGIREKLKTSIESLEENLRTRCYRNRDIQRNMETALANYKRTLAILED